MTKNFTTKSKKGRNREAGFTLPSHQNQPIQLGRKRSRRSIDRGSPSRRSIQPWSSKKIRQHDRSNQTVAQQDCPNLLTPDAIESIVMGIDLFHNNNNNNNNIHSGDDNDDLKKPAKQLEATGQTTTAHKTNVERKKNLILRMRFDKLSDTTAGSEDQSSLYGMLGDGKYSIRVMLLDPERIWSKRLHAEGDARDWIIEVHGYAATEKFWHIKYRIFPVVCLTSISVLYTTLQRPLGNPLFSNTGGNNSFLEGVTCKAQAGTIGTFLKERGPFLTNEELAGTSRILDPKMETVQEGETTGVPTPLVSSSLRDDNFKKVQECLSRHSAMLTLQQSSSSNEASSTTANASSLGASAAAAATENPPSPPQPPGSPSKTKKPTQHAWELYNSALRAFRTSQVDRQQASLGTNAGRESAERAELVIQRHNEALELALKEDGPLSVELLVKWHEELLRGLHPEAGKIRTRKVRCGHTVFCPPERIQKELELYCAGLKSLELRLDMTNNALHVILFAAVAMFGIVDIHPFLDGNGRLSRIVANYALKKLPFPINLFATPVQRNKYVVALERTRHVLAANCAFGDVSRDDLIQVIKYNGVFGALVDLLMDRVARAATALVALWDEKSCLAAEAAEARAARRVRERAAKGTCMICLDEKPNIATLCCGNAIHLNCCAEWLSGNNKCPICRHEMPSISGRVVRAMEDPREEQNEEESENQNPMSFSREYQHFVDRFWSEIRHGVRGSPSRGAPPNRRSRDEDEEYYVADTTTAEEEDTGVRMRGQDRSDIDDSDSMDSMDDETDFHMADMETIRRNVSASGQRGGPVADRRSTVYELMAARMNASVSGQRAASAANRRPTLAGLEANESADGSDQQGDEFNDTTTTFEDDDDDEELENSDTSDSMTTTVVESSEDNTTTTGDFSDTSTTYHEPQQHAVTFCASSACRNRPALDCTNMLCGRCCVLNGLLHCPRHHC